GRRGRATRRPSRSRRDDLLAGRVVAVDRLGGMVDPAALAPGPERRRGGDEQLGAPGRHGAELEPRGRGRLLPAPVLRLLMAETARDHRDRVLGGHAQCEAPNIRTPAYMSRARQRGTGGMPTAVPSVVIASRNTASACPRGQNRCV